MWYRLGNYRCSAVLVAACWGLPICSAGKLCATWSGIVTAHRCYQRELRTDAYMRRPSGTMCSHSTGDPGMDTLTSLQRDSRVSPSQLQAQWEQASTSEMDGPTHGALFAMLDRASSTWKTCQASLLGPTDISGQFSESWPRSGIMRGGECYLLPMLERLTSATVSGLGAGYATPTATANQLAPSMQKHPSCRIWATPRASDADRGDCPSERNRRSPSLVSAVKMLPTPNARDVKDRGGPENKCIKRRKEKGKQIDLSMTVTGQLNPMWVEWLMGWPLGWTDLEPLAMDKFRSWLQQHGRL